ncbi:hypothetical protein J6590_011334 [Homalodisca vitripennis]|nr:hypothetical protein J6590_011334 [Homalodisca vitripennis]
MLVTAHGAQNTTTLTLLAAGTAHDAAFIFMLEKKGWQNLHYRNGTWRVTAAIYSEVSKPQAKVAPWQFLPVASHTSIWAEGNN